MYHYSRDIKSGAMMGIKPFNYLHHIRVNFDDNIWLLSTFNEVLIY